METACATAKRTFERYEIRPCWNTCAAATTVIVHSIDRISRNILDLRNIVKAITDKNPSIRFIKENLTFTCNVDPVSMLLLTVIGAVAECEHAIMLKRQREGIAAARKKGYVYPGRKPELTPEAVEKAKEVASLGVPKREIACKIGIPYTDFMNLPDLEAVVKVSGNYPVSAVPNMTSKNNINTLDL